MLKIAIKLGRIIFVQVSCCLAVPNTTEHTTIMQAMRMGLVTHITQGENVLNEYEYDAWGEVVHQRETIENRFKFNGQQLDPITGQYYLRARFYNPVIARFTQEDTYRGDELNLYAYCGNNPVYYVDPTGNSCKSKGEIYEKLRQEGIPAHVAYQQSFGKDLLKPDLPFTDLMSAEDRVRYNKWIDSNQPVRPVAVELSEFDGKTTHGLLVLDDGSTISIVSGNGDK